MLNSEIEVLIFTVENYHDQNIGLVKYANADGELFYNTLVDIGVPEENIKHIKGHRCTLATIEAEIDIFTKRLTGESKAFIYFAGHGISMGGDNRLMPVDANDLNYDLSTFKIKKLFGYFKESDCTQNVIFLDCCHSGYVIGDLTRSNQAKFQFDKLSVEEYSIAFASCKNDEKSISLHKLGHGVWSYFLCKAMSGSEVELYTSGKLLSASLQSYLRKEVSGYVRDHSTNRRNQTPTCLGTHTDQFVLVDLTKVIQDNHKSLLPDFDFTSKSFYFSSMDNGWIKSLPGFRKSSHRVPDGYYADEFVKKIGNGVLTDRVDVIYDKMQEINLCTRKEVSVFDGDEGFVSVKTPMFTFDVSIEQFEDNYQQYKVKEVLTPCSGWSEEDLTHMNFLFGDDFNAIGLELKGENDLKEIIDCIESIEELSVAYDKTGFSYCLFSFDELDVTIERSRVYISKFNGGDNINTLMELMEYFLGNITKYPSLCAAISWK